jgi:hypothetical protein
MISRDREVAGSSPAAGIFYFFWKNIYIIRIRQ